MTQEPDQAFDTNEANSGQEQARQRALVNEFNAMQHSVVGQRTTSSSNWNPSSSSYRLSLSSWPGRPSIASSAVAFEVEDESFLRLPGRVFGFTGDAFSLSDSSAAVQKARL
jgi:hypothetical protein